MAVPVVYSVPMRDSLLYYEKNTISFLREVLKYIFLGRGILTCPVLDLAIFANTDTLDSNSRLHTSALPLDARDPHNLPNVEIMPVRTSY